MANQTKLTLKKKDLFLEALFKERSVSKACQVVHISRFTAYAHRQVDVGFATRWDEIHEQISDDLEAEAYRRAVEGIEKPIFYEGKEIARVKEYSDTLLIFLLKANRPQKFRELYKHEITGKDGGPIPIKVIVGIDETKL